MMFPAWRCFHPLTESVCCCYLIVAELEVQMFVLLIRLAAPVSAVYTVTPDEVQCSRHHLPLLLSNNQQHLITHLCSQPVNSMTQAGTYDTKFSHLSQRFYKLIDGSVNSTDVGRITKRITPKA